MSRFLKIGFLLSALVLPWLGLGCGNRPPTDAEFAELNVRRELNEIHEIYGSAEKKNEKPPGGLADLAEYFKMAPTTFQAVQNGEIAIVWGIHVGRGEKALLAYETASLEKGGTVILADGSTKKMSADELKAAVQAKQGAN
jgi:hypothetical protein